VEESKILERRKSRLNFQEIFDDTIQRLKDIVEETNKSDLLTRNIFEADEDSQDIEYVILRSLLDGKLKIICY
jgi:hypothetical protein